MKNRVGRKKDFIEKNTLVIQTVYGMDEMKSMFVKGGLKRLSSPTCLVPALDSARANWPPNRLSPAKRTDIDARVTSQPCFPEREAGGSCICKPSTGNVARTLRPTAKAERQTEAQEDALLNVFDSAIAQLICVTLVFGTAA